MILSKTKIVKRCHFTNISTSFRGIKETRNWVKSYDDFAWSCRKSQIPPGSNTLLTRKLYKHLRLHNSKGNCLFYCFPALCVLIVIYVPRILKKLYSKNVELWFGCYYLLHEDQTAVLKRKKALSSEIFLIWSDMRWNFFREIKYTDDFWPRYFVTADFKLNQRFASLTKWDFRIMTIIPFPKWGYFQNLIILSDNLECTTGTQSCLFFYPTQDSSSSFLSRKIGMYTYWNSWN